MRTSRPCITLFFCLYTLVVSACGHQPGAEVPDPLMSDADGGSSADGAMSCVPSCGGRICGSDGCGGLCGPNNGGCAAGLVCNGKGQCVSNCQPNCSGRNCGSDGCNGSCGSNNGQCSAGQICNGGQCACQPNCNGRNCGADGCGGTCGPLAGQCMDGYECNNQGTCGYTGYSVLNWTVENGCNQTAQFRFFDITRNLLWPNSNQFFTLATSGRSTYSLRCNVNSKICFGGQPAGGNGFWGLGLNGSQSCANCCYFCTNSSVSLPRLGC